MGVSYILLWEPSEGLNPGQALEFLQKRLEMLGGRCQGAWSVDCETLQSAPSLAAGQKIVYLLHSTENSLDTIFVHLKQFYAPRKQLKIEAKGQMYLVKQYAVKFGAISVGAGNRGFVVEVEDKQNNRVSQCWNDLTTFTKGLLHSSQAIDVPSFARQTDRPYTPADAMTHYASIFNQLRKPPTNVAMK